MWIVGDSVKKNKIHLGLGPSAKIGARALLAFIFCSLLSFTLSAQSVVAATGPSKRPNAQNLTAQRLGAKSAQNLVVTKSGVSTSASLIPAAPGDRCDGSLGGAPIWLIGGWITGEELYTAYQDPSINCPGAYPFTIDTVNIFLDFFPGSTDTLLPFVYNVSVDVRGVDTITTPGCAIPGPILFTGSLGSISIPSKDFFNIAIPLDVPLVVNGPYFVGINFPDVIPATQGVRLVTDEIEALCVSYNFWDSTIGFVDLGDDTAIRHEAFLPDDPCYNITPGDSLLCFDFDGRMLLWSQGIVGGEPPVPIPGIAILGPAENDKLFGSTDIWVAETSGSPAIDSAVFYQRTASTSWSRIGVDANQDIAFGRGATLGAGQGLSYLWDFSAETEETHWIKVEIYDSLAQMAIDSVSVFLEPTPPVPILTEPSYFSRFCDTLSLLYDIIDEDPTSILLLKKSGDLQFSQTLETQYQFALGDVDGDTADGNPASEGEFGDFYGGPAVGAMALRYWHDQGFIQSIRVGSGTLTNAQIVERLETFMNIRVNGGLSDESFVLGFRQYLIVTGFSELRLEFKRQASYETLRNWTEEFGVCAMIRVAGVNGGAGNWFAVDGYDGLPATANNYRVRVSDPSDGAIKTLFWRDGFDGAEMFYQGSWRAVDIITGLFPTNWSTTGRTTIDFIFGPSAQASFLLDSMSNGLTDGGLYFITSQVTDQNSNLGEKTVLLELNCASFAIGDYDGNGLSNIGDLVYLIAFQLQGGPPPVGGAIRGDVNCDNGIDTADLIFYINWVFAGGPAPCR